MQRSLITVIALVVAAGVARADSTARARRALAAGQYAQALAGFTSARQKAGPADDDFSCEIGLAHHGLGDPARAHFFLGLCLEAPPDPDLAARAARARADAEAELVAGDYAPITIEASPHDARAYVATFDPNGFATPRLVWLPIASHTIGARAPGHFESARQVILYGRDGATVAIDLEPIAADPARVAATVDFGDEAAGEVTTSDDLPEVEHETLMPERFRRGGVAHSAARRQRPRLTVGIEAGVCRSRLADADAAATSARTGATAAVRIEYRVAPRFALGSGLGFAMRGADHTAIDYLTIPLTASYRQPTGPTELAALAGAELSVAVRGDFEDHRVAAFDLAVVAGVGLRIPTGRRVVTADLRYALGLTTVDDTAPTTMARNRSLALVAGVQF